jgi:hypothetical protein
MENSHLISPLLADAIAWMYRHRDLLNEGYSGRDPDFATAKSVYLSEMQIGAARSSIGTSTYSREDLLKAFEDALNRV